MMNLSKPIIVMVWAATLGMGFASTGYGDTQTAGCKISPSIGEGFVVSREDSSGWGIAALVGKVANFGDLEVAKVGDLSH